MAYLHRLVILITLLPVIASGHDLLQVPEFQYHFRTISLEDGLPSSAVNDVIQRQDQFVWIATRNGLAKYLGHSFKVYRFNQNDPLSLGSNDVTVLFEDSLFRLWVGTDNGLYLFQDDSDSFHRIRLGLRSQGAVILSIFESSKGDLWIGTEKGLSQISREGKLVRHLSSNNSPVLENDNVKYITEDKAKSIWFATKRGLYQIRENKLERKTLEDEKFDIRDERFFGGARKGDVIWLASDGDGIIQYDMGKGIIVAQWLTNNSELKSNKVWSLVWHQDKLGIAYFYNGFSLFFENDNRMDHIEHHFQVSYSLPYNEVSSLFFENNNLLWVGTTDGLAITHLENRDISHIGLYQGLLNQHVWDTAVLNNDLWVAHEDGLSVYNMNTGLVENLKQSESVLDKTIVWQLQTDNKAKRIWLGTNRGLYYYKDGKVHSVDYPQPRDVNGIPLPIYSLSMNDDWLYVAYTLGGHLKLSRSSEQLEEYHMISDSDVIDNTISSFHWDGHWLIANRYELKRPLHESQDIDWINNWITDKDIEISTLMSMGKKLWLGSRKRGIFIFNTLDQTVEAIKLDGNQGNNEEYQVQCMLRGKSGDVWVTTNQQIYKVLLPSLSIQKLTSNFHWLKMEFNQNACSYLNEASVSFAGTRGVVFFDEEKRTSWAFDPVIALTNVTIMGESRYTRAAQQHSIDISPDETFYQFTFSSLDHLAPNKVSFEYRLLPVSLSWQQLSSSGELTLSQLPYGEYKIEVKGTNSDGVWGSKPVTIDLNVIAPWYWNIYSQVLYISALLLLIVWKIRNYRGRLKIADYAATHDALTDLPNRVLLNQYLADTIELARSDKFQFAVLFLDLNKFKPINDTYGHKVGDEVLVTFSKRLKSAVRKEDIVARLSGDEFVIVVTSRQEAVHIEQVVNRIYDVLEAPFVKDDIRIPIETSIGVCVYQHESPRPKVSTLLKRADAAMYQCKQQQLDFVVYDRQA